MYPDIKNINFEKYTDNLVPVIIQDYLTTKVLMLGYMNQEAYQLTIDTKQVHFFSRSKNRIWLKGESSSNFLNLVTLNLDCDQDAMIAQVIPDGPTCHRNTDSCFDDYDSGFLDSLAKLIKSRFKEENAESYVRSLYQKGLDKIAQKVGEEAVETVIASKNENEQEFINESSDLLFHFLILLKYKNYDLNDLVKCLYSRKKT